MHALRIAALTALLALSAAAQSPLDPALLAKANAGDPSAQLAAGEALTRTAAALTDPDDRDAALAQAAIWYRKAADQNNLASELRLAEAFRDGRGLPRDPAQAAIWYRKAAEQGDSSAQATLGVLYSLGHGVPQDDAEAYFWFDVASLTPGPGQQKCAANRQAIGMRITADQFADEQKRLKSWKTTHPQPNLPIH
ncbi:MAG: tetratricopeptide repeat protein [Devosia sp.]|nr:tetratricopeptide repeat protein [Devosia sp.]